jgi:peroxiredoxin
MIRRFSIAEAFPKVRAWRAGRSWGLVLLALLCIGSGSLLADWAQVTALDLPVTKLSPDPLKARLSLKERFETQIAVNEAFLKQYPDDPHVYDSKLRMAVAQARLGSLEQNPSMVKAALNQLAILENQAPDENQRAEASFRLISLQWQDLGKDPDQRRERAVASAQAFAQRYPQDRRSARLLAEAASLCDNHPEQKRPLIQEALGLSTEPALTLRLKDDLKRLDQLGNPVTLSFTDTGGATIDLARYRGKVVALVFWAAESAPSLLWMRDFTTYASEVPDLKVVGVSLDQDRTDLDAAIKALNIDWPVAFDGKGWQNSIARQLGINAIPTLWLIDRQGTLRALNARDNYQFIINGLLRQ